MGLKFLFSNKYFFHFLFWIFFVLSLIADSITLYNNSWTYIFYIMGKTTVQAALVYINILVLYPLFFRKKKYLLYLLFVMMVTLVAGYYNLKLEHYVSYKESSVDDGKHLQFFLSQLGMAARYIVISFLLKISVDYYVQRERLKRIEIEKTKAELNFLKAQVNPHFLFNTLNNLYALILERSDKAGEAVLKLADIMKYILAEGKEDKVILQKELDLLYNYTELEKLRKPDAEIIFRSSGNTQSHLVTPLLLLPLVENAFKYGLNSVSKNGFVRINIVAESKTVNVSVENNIPPVKNNSTLR